MKKIINHLPLHRCNLIPFVLLCLSFTIVSAENHVIEFGGPLGNNYSPSELSVSVGDTVTWIGSFSSHPLLSTSVPQGAAGFEKNSGTSFSYLVQVAGTYNYECDFHVSLGMKGTFSATVSSIESSELSVQPEIFRLEQNQPNPFNPATTISYQLPVANAVELSIYNLLGMKIATLVSEWQPAGIYEVHWDAGENASGVYYYLLISGDYSDSKKMVLIK